MLEIARDIAGEPARSSYGAVERRAHLTAAELATYLLASKPVIIEGALERCPASSRWASPAALAERVGDVLVPLTSSSSGAIRYYRHLPQVPTPFSECVRRIFSNDGVSYYVHQTNLLEQAPQLGEDLVFPYPELGLRFNTEHAEVHYGLFLARVLERGLSEVRSESWPTSATSLEFDDVLIRNAQEGQESLLFEHVGTLVHS